MKKITAIFCLLIFVSKTKAQQDPQFNMYQFNQMIINPAYAGSRDALSVVAIVRNQWVSFPGAPKTLCLSGHAPILNKNIGVGATIMRDEIGPRNTTGIYGNFAYILKLSQKVKLSLGLNAGYNRYQFNYNELTFSSSEAPPAELLSSLTKGTLDMNGGLFLKAPSFYFGLSASHINTPSVYTYSANTVAGASYSYRVKTHIFLTAGYSYIINNNFIFAPAIMVKQVPDNLTADVNFNFFIYKKMWLGVFYRSGFGPGALMQFYATSKLRLGLSYDTGLSDARNLGSSFEVMIGYDFASNKSRTVNPRFL
jgi:type IX secretion system PorP/SprF family membrane protein